MNYEENTIDWKEGDFVLHDADAKEQRMLMIITGYDKETQMYSSRYVFQEQIVGDRKVYLNNKKYLHDPARFDVRLPTTKELHDNIVYVQPHSYHVLGCMNITLKSFCPCYECGNWNGVICESEDPENEFGDMYEIVQGRWEIKKFDIPKEEVLLDMIPSDDIPKRDGTVSCQTFKGKDVQAIKEIKGWLMEKIEYYKFCITQCQVGSREEKYFLEGISFYNRVLDKVIELKVEEGDDSNA